jgi:hypothetical protein
MPDDAMTAVQMMRHVSAAAARMAESAGRYIDVMEAEPRPEVKPGEFYVTFDYSLAYIARRNSRCRCPACTGKVANLMGLQITLPPEFAQAMEQRQQEAAEHEEAKEKLYVAIILRGGHGVKDLQGEQPGDRYLVNGEGWTVFSKPDDETKGVTSTSQLAMSGLSLRRRIQVRIEEQG